MKYVTIKDIAAELGISKSTVSRALNGDVKNVSKETLQKIVDTATKMGYRRNELAVNLRSKSNHVIGILVPEITTPFAMTFVAAAQQIVSAKGYRVSIAFSNESPETERMNLEMFLNSRVDGILISTCHNTANLSTYEDILQRKIPLVFFDRTIAELPVSSVRSNDYIKSFFMVEHLILSGKRKILHVAGPSHIQNTIERTRGYRDALAKFKIPFNPEFVIPCGVDVEDGSIAIERAIHKGLDFDAVFCFTETQAFGAKRCLQEHGLAIPKAVAICCMSGTILSTLVYPQITAVEQQVGEMAKVATSLLLDKINDFSAPDQTIILNAKMIVRNSTVDQALPENGQ